MEQTKFCHRCETDLARNNFYTNKKRLDGLQTYCKKCMKKTNAASYQLHKEDRDKKSMEYAKTEKSKKYRREWAKEKYENNEDHRKNIIKKVVEREREQLNTNGLFKLKHLLRTQLRKAVNRQLSIKHDSILNMIGCSINFLREYLSNKFKDGMTWEERSKWHIDHIIPCAAFDLNDELEQKACFHYTNLQPMWAKENIQKSDKYSIKEKEEYICRVRPLLILEN